MRESIALLTQALVPAVIALAVIFSTQSRGQVVYQWHPYFDCVVSGKCLAQNAACGGAGSAGQRCRYCENPMTMYECEFDLFENCYEVISQPAPTITCGSMFVGACNLSGTNCTNGVLNGRTCPRPDCS